MRRLLARVPVAVLLAVVLVLGLVGGVALASIPSSDGFVHACIVPGNPTTPHKLWYALDKDVGNCPSGTFEIKLVGTAGP